MSRVVSGVAVALCALPPSNLAGQVSPTPEQRSFFSAVVAELSQDLFGAGFRFGPLELFLSCEADAPCVLVAPRVHVALARVIAESGTDEVTLRLDRTGDQDASVRRRFWFLTLSRSEGGWRVTDRRIVGAS